VEEREMKKLILGAALAVLMSSAAQAERIGVTMALFDDNFLTVLRNGIQDLANKTDGVDVQIEDAQNDVAKQLDQINNFIASGVDAIIVNPVDTSATEAMTNAASSAGVPLVYVNRQPINVDSLPDNQAFVASNEIESGTLAAFEGCKLLRAKGKAGGANIYVLMGELSNQAAVQRTKDFHDVIGMDMCNFIKIIDEQTANWSRDEAQAMKAGGISMEEVIVTGVDATQDALVAMGGGDLDVTVFQDAHGQGAGALDAALKLARGETVDQKVYIPFQLVTPANIGDFLAKN
jgi:inositol transport system substrate-binding protein